MEAAAAARPAERSNAPPYERWPTVPHDQSDSTTRTKPAAAAAAAGAGAGAAAAGAGAGAAAAAMDLDRIVSSSMGELGRPPTAFSLDDLEVAEALTGLREASPAQSTTTLTSHHSRTLKAQSPPAPYQSQPEPLLSLLTSQHPLVATAINNSISAYTSSKTYSPRFRQGAEFVERNIASPVASTVGTAGRISGVETGVRWWLQRHNSSHDSSHEPGNANKRQRLDREADGMDVERAIPHRSRAPSDFSQPEYLPPYDSNRSPVYEEFALSQQNGGHDHHAPTLQNWQTRFMMSTSGLGVAMSEESLRSLKYCLSWLRWANSHLSNVLASLQAVLQEWERSQALSQDGTLSACDASVSPSRAAYRPLGPDGDRPPRDQAVITSHLAALKAECVKTLKNAFDVVSTYAGGALPENARALVRRHLTSLPTRFRIANDASGSNGHVGSHAESDPEAQSKAPDVVSGAQRVVVLAREGLDMMSQVSVVVNGTIVSAEDWCDRLGRRRPEDRGPGDEKMEGGNRNGVVQFRGPTDVDMTGAEKL